MVFSITDNGHTALLPIWPSLQISIEIGICNQKYRASEPQVDLDIRPKSQRLL
jgi:hypothetical protein